ncbi:MAG TPA: hypothetical protein VJP60_06880 [Rhizomicrobium sp.]|nr:hypothetical protein [Rhizomicrobium sp.]
MPKISTPLLAVGLALCWAGAGQAQTASQPAPHNAPPDAFRHFSDSELAKLSTGKGPLSTSALSDHQNYYVLAVGRSGPGEVEVHEHWIDYAIIQQGEAEFTYGGTLTGAHETGPGEKRGGTITGGTVMNLKPGDFLEIPAGQPHLTMIKPGSSFRAIIFKVRD